MRYTLNYSGTRFLSTDYSVSWWIPSYKLWYVESEQTLARSIAIDIFIRVRFKQRSCMARYVDE